MKDAGRYRKLLKIDAPKETKSTFFRVWACMRDAAYNSDSIILGPLSSLANDNTCFTWEQYVILTGCDLKKKSRTIASAKSTNVKETFSFDMSNTDCDQKILVTFLLVSTSPYFLHIMFVGIIEIQ